MDRRLDLQADVLGQLHSLFTSETRKYGLSALNNITSESSEKWFFGPIWFANSQNSRLSRCWGWFCLANGKLLIASCRFLICVSLRNLQLPGLLAGKTLRFQTRTPGSTATDSSPRR